MKLSNEQLGRIARTLRNHSRHTTQTVLIDAIDGRIGDAIETAMYTAAPTHGLIDVLREVAAEMERDLRKCRVQIADKKSVLIDVAVPGDSAMNDASRFYAVALGWARRVTISNERDGTCWTWEAER